MASSHVKIGFLTLLLVALLAVPAAWLTKNGSITPPSTTIAVEHVAPVVIEISRLVSSGTNVLEFTVAGSGGIALHVPRSWSRQEVRGSPLSSITSTPQDWNFVRWTIPSGSTVRFDAPNPGRITLHNPSGIRMTVTAVNINPKTGTREDDARIVTDDPYVLP